MILSTKPNYTRWPQPAEIEEENVPEGEDPDNPNYTTSEAEELMTGRAWYVENYHRDPPANCTPWPCGLAGRRRLHRKHQHPDNLVQTATDPRFVSHRVVRAFLSLQFDFSEFLYRLRPLSTACPSPSNPCFPSLPYPEPQIPQSEG